MIDKPLNKKIPEIKIFHNETFGLSFDIPFNINTLRGMCEEASSSKEP
jgi:hypothetical protein